MITSSNRIPKVFRNLSLALLMTQSLLPIATAQDDSPSIDTTVEWINHKLQETGVCVWVRRLSIINGISGSAYRSGYQISLTDDGSLKVTYTFDNAAGDMRQQTAEEDIFEWWKKFNAEDLVIVNLNQTGIQWDDPNCPVLAVRTTNGDKFLLPLPPSSELQTRMLKAFRHLLEKSKTERKEAF